jgi:hypothetical protein
MSRLARTPSGAVARARLPVIMGNAGARLLDPAIPASVSAATAWARRMSAWCAAQLTTDDLEYIRSFVPTLTVAANSISMLRIHGSPRQFR